LLTGLLNYLEWTITRRAVAEYGGNKSHAAKIFYAPTAGSKSWKARSPGHNLQGTTPRTNRNLTESLQLKANLFARVSYERSFLDCARPFTDEAYVLVKFF
jgi:hypothetical protein